MEEKDARPIRVALVDDHALVRMSVRYLLEAEEGIAVVAEGSSGREALALARQGGIDVLILDLAMNGESGLDVIGRISRNWPRVGVLVLTGFDEETYAAALLKRGARGYLNKACEPAEIVQAVRCIADGRRYLQPRLAELLFDHLHQPNPAAPHEEFSPRELQVLVRMARGQATRDVARELFLSPKTVGAYRARLLGKLGLRSATDLTYYAIKHGLIE